MMEVSGFRILISACVTDNKYFSVRKWYPQECVPCKSHCLLTLAELWPDGSQYCFFVTSATAGRSLLTDTAFDVALGLEVRSPVGLTAEVRGSVGFRALQMPQG